VRCFAEYVAMLGSSTSNGGVFGAKVHWYQLSTAMADGWVRGLTEVVPPSARRRMTVVRLRRVDRVAQAVSIYLAQKTGIYVLATDGSRHDPVQHDKPYWGEHATTSVNDELSRIAASIERAEAAWDEHLERLDVPVLSIEYEGLVADYATVVREVLGFVGGGDIGASDVPPPSTLRQANEVNVRLAANYHKHLHLRHCADRRTEEVTPDA
jgi:LPS sulfotransferase NodH